jgi:hypothetical protein
VRVFAELPTVSLVVWGLAAMLTLFLLLRMIVFRQHRVFYFFALYLGINLAQTAIGVVLYQGYGFASSTTYAVAWTTQGLVVVGRAFAAAEVCHLVLGAYKGIWALAARILSFCGLLVLGLALYFGRSGYHVGVITLEIGLEASIATGIAGLFLFARYYQVRIAPQSGWLALGLGLFSCFKVLNDLAFERFARAYGIEWNHASMLAFVAALLVWTWALRDPLADKVPAPSLKPAHLYANLIPQVNQRLTELNEHLTRLWNLESPKP